MHLRLGGVDDQRESEPTDASVLITRRIRSASSARSVRPRTGPGRARRCSTCWAGDLQDAVVILGQQQVLELRAALGVERSPIRKGARFLLHR